MTEDEIKKRKLRWKCRRGMLELDIILNDFFDKHYDELNEEDKLLFARVLEMEDSELYACLMRSQSMDDKQLMEMIGKISE